MPIDLNQTHANQMPGDGAITVFLTHSHASQTRSSERVQHLCSILRRNEMGTYILQDPIRNASGSLLFLSNSREILGSHKHLTVSSEPISET